MANFDIPEALDFSLLRENLLSFKQNNAVALPTYDFTTHQRRTPTEPRNHHRRGRNHRSHDERRAVNS